MELVELVETLRVLSDPIRLRVVHLLWARQDRGWTVNEIVEVLDLPQPTISRHLAILREEKVIQCAHEGRYRRYRLADVQHRLHAAVLAALEPFVVESVDAQLDRERSHASELTRAQSDATDELHVDEAEEEHMSRVFSALGHPTRRRILDRVSRNQGVTIGEVAEGFESSRVAVSKHVGVLEDAGLIHSRREGRERRLFADAVPLQLAYDRWTNPWTARLATHVVDLKRRAEA